MLWSDPAGVITVRRCDSPESLSTMHYSSLCIDRNKRLVKAWTSHHVATLSCHLACKPAYESCERIVQENKSSRMLLDRV